MYIKLIMKNPLLKRVLLLLIFSIWTFFGKNIRFYDACFAPTYIGFSTLAFYFTFSLILVLLAIFLNNKISSLFLSIEFAIWLYFFLAFRGCPIEYTGSTGSCTQYTEI